MSLNTNPSASPLNVVRRGTGKPLLLLHGLGGNIASWGDLIDALATTNAVIAVDLPGHGASPVTPDAGTFRGIADAIADFIHAEEIVGIDCVGHSVGGRVALEMARRDLVGATVALAPGGFWSAGESRFLKVSLLASGRFARLSRPALPTLTRHAAGRAALLAQISARPAQVPPEMALRELRSFAATPTFDALTRDLADGPVQKGTEKTRGPVTIVWGRKDRLLLPRQAGRAAAAFPQARLHWIADAGHYIPWDAPDETLSLIRQEIGPQEVEPERGART
ncbi:alpha/beta fold hydrolase [Citreimonas salinaria]|uniref:Pimeloyl-ACP methyl ester carboxylesterase n=1 Tax=Citreimonas salinaria TaxID=321339 RepID=A0A1H3P6N5_9RHOB|nr:alpha/beta fold hydrolase [Citreimonas salinaria]SDY96824.1 Pimeloyl-ACP methyl ester carboxylesterase [Citreimonas salinaria]